MYQNYHFLRQLSQALRPLVVGLKFMECFSQEKDELVIVLAHARGKNNYYRPFFLRATLRPDFACLHFPEDFSRARHNSVDLFETLYDLEVVDVRQFKNERAFGLVLENNYTLVFKLFGNRSNAVLFQEEAVIDVFHNKLVSDNNLQLAKLDRELDQSWEAFEAAGHDHRKLFPTFGKEVNAYLEQQSALSSQPSVGLEKWTLIQGVLQKLEQPTYYISTWQYQITFSLVPLGEVIRSHTDPIEALNDFYTTYNRIGVISKEKSEAVRVLQKRIQRTENYLEEAFQKLVTVDGDVKNEEIGHILMANLHQIPERAERVTLFDFYRDRDIDIKLKSDLSPQRNAETYYRKAKNERIEIDKLQENIALREGELEDLKSHLQEIEAFESLKLLRKYLKNNSLLTDAPILSPTQLFKHTEFEGYVILIGKNAKNNDLLTKKYAYKEDLWLHARDVSGSHVVIKYKAGRKIPNSVIERAAQLAAWYSKRRTETLCPVIVTPKKFVRKPKGLPEGEVVLDKEEVVMVEPRGL
ncbi:putative ribosome quality control (RQC) complex YloA/Tae2 family protein [Runella defluvii]|uniref:Putative ribosome quality control (RQC) complex YloA/Tae2 family protein n=1 Tax=Runella defluvii TaxID=370973 RepID=A0A7W5ZKC4_9BACT|nr:NFACT RNA binding domain-containing protein [Runella defluvii]MBB3838419.1 putative ribosome quality control (RQC) complex YloA/Tae2 family protein [Runella defluvii]